MNAYKTYITITNPNQVVLTDLPFRPGQRVEVVILADDERAARVEKLKALLAETQALPQAQAVSEDEIAAEIAAYRAGP
jgi:antitoxin ParD1/3/4